MMDHWIWAEYHTVTKYSFEGEGREDLCRFFFLFFSLPRFCSGWSWD